MGLSSKSIVIIAKSGDVKVESRINVKATVARRPYIYIYIYGEQTASKLLHRFKSADI